MSQKRDKPGLFYIQIFIGEFAAHAVVPTSPRNNAVALAIYCMAVDHSARNEETGSHRFLLRSPQRCSQENVAFAWS